MSELDRAAGPVITPLVAHLAGISFPDNFPPPVTRALAYCSAPAKHIVLNSKLLTRAAARVQDEPLFALIHEFTHLRHPGLRHGREFERIAATVYGRMIGDTRVEQWIKCSHLWASRRRLLARDRRLRAHIIRLQAQIREFQFRNDLGSIDVEAYQRSEST